MPYLAFNYAKAFHKEVDDIMAKLRRLDVKGAKRLARRSLVAGNRIIQRYAKNLAPKRTGKLKRSGIVILDVPGKPGTVKRITSTARREKLGISPDSPWYYPAIVEFGVKKGPRQFAGRRFMRGAFGNRKQDAMMTIIETFNAGFEAELAKKR